jgi:hypothetical protein
MVVLLSQDKILGREAVEILKLAAPRREVIWDSLVVAETAETMLAKL